MDYQRRMKQWNRINIWSNNAWEFSKTNDKLQIIDPGSAENSKLDKSGDLYIVISYSDCRETKIEKLLQEAKQSKQKQTARETKITYL